MVKDAALENIGLIERQRIGPDDAVAQGERAMEIIQRKERHRLFILDVEAFRRQRQGAGEAAGSFAVPAMVVEADAALAKAVGLINRHGLQGRRHERRREQRPREPAHQRCSENARA